MMFPFHFESKVEVNASADAVFLVLDDPKRLSAHMSKSSWMMAGSRMVIELDAAEGRSVGSKIRLSGSVLSIPIWVEEAVTERTPPLRKVWETKGAPRLLVIGHYRIGYEITPQDNSSALRVFIDYALPHTLPARWLGKMFGALYARWCTDRMTSDAARHFNQSKQR